MADFWDSIGGTGMGWDTFWDPNAGLDLVGMGNRPQQRAQQAATDAANTQRYYGGIANQQLGQSYRQANRALDPYSQSGQVGLGGLQNFQGAGDPGMYQSQQYGGPGQFSLSDLQNDPGYQFRLNAGLDAVQSRLGPQGMGRSGGNAMVALNDYAQGFASNEANNAFGRFANQRDFGRGMYENDRNFGYQNFGDTWNRRYMNSQQDLGRLQGLAQMGYGAAGQKSQNSMNYGQMYGNNLMGIGNSIAGGQVGAANAINQGGMNNQQGLGALLGLLLG